jgi:hypothetical protein
MKEISEAEIISRIEKNNFVTEEEGLSKSKQ